MSGVDEDIIRSNGYIGLVTEVANAEAVIACLTNLLP